GESVVAVIRHANRVRFIGPRNGHKHRAKDLLPRQAPVVGNVGEDGGAAIHYNTRHTDPGSGAGAPPQIRSCGRDIPGGSTWRTRGRHTGLGGADDTLGATSGLRTQVVYVQSRACTDRAASAKRRAREGPI